ncbi:MAG: DNA alkylation repair protein [Planctomycetaceae bacterium]
MTAAEIVEELRALGRDSIKKVLTKHGIAEPLFGVKVEELKKIQKRLKKDYQLSLDLYATGIYDAMYLAGLIADDHKMSKKDLQNWVKKATCDALCNFTVAWVAAESLHGWDLATEWIDSKKDKVALAGWATLSSLVGIKDNSDLDLVTLQSLVLRVQKEIHSAPNAVRSAMNSFMIAVGTYVSPLTELVLKTSKKIGTVVVDVGEISCKVPYAPDSIEKAQKKGAIGKKRKTAKC